MTIRALLLGYAVFLCGFVCGLIATLGMTRIASKRDEEVHP